MGLRDLSQVPWVCEVSEIFEAAYWRRLDSIDQVGFAELLQTIEETLERDPRSIGVPHPRLEGIWVYESPALVRLPSVIISYEIIPERGIVKFWNCHLASQ